MRYSNIDLVLATSIVKVSGHDWIPAENNPRWSNRRFGHLKYGNYLDLIPKFLNKWVHYMIM